MASRKYKVVLLGEGSVGKTSLFMQFCHSDFDAKHNTTLQATYETKRITLADNTRVDLNIWDTAGQERFHSISHIHYRGAQGAVLVYDITDANSFVRVQNWVKELRKMLGSECVLVIAGNKIDLEKMRVVNKDEAIAYATEVGAVHRDTSAKQNIGVREVFSELTKLIVQSDKNPAGTMGGGRSKGFVIDDVVSDSPKNESCCS
eukprot:TRINITY_DN186_c5_g1_i1.p1 TRINITY_DN186_c5_g1~~TRINITY_DN186_c5_g1_i1.p1  ORF type:complete len:213 (+),score=35.43 TRINITY_DN186_c5_g1_i1:29-640(+)